MVSIVSIKGLDKAAVLAALFNNSRQQGMGVFDTKGMNRMSIEDAKKEIDSREKSKNFYFDYLRGRVMKIDLGDDEIDTRLYDRDNGQGSAAAAVDSIRKVG